jgi:hypothetical protein
MQDHTQRLGNVVKDALKEEALLGEQYGYNVVQGLCETPTAVDEAGNVSATSRVLGWTVTVSMKNPLLGYPDIALAAPLPAVLPPDVYFRTTAKQLLIAVRQKRDEAAKMPPPTERKAA